MNWNLALAQRLTEQYGCPLYVFDEAEFRENYAALLNAFRRQYDRYEIAYSFKTNYTPYVASVVRELGGYAEVVSAMEYTLARKLGFPDAKIVFNGPDKGQAGIEAFLNGALVNADSLTELETLCQAALAHPDGTYHVGLRVNADVGQSFLSRFGMDPEQLPQAFAMVCAVENLTIHGLHCHISRCRGLEAWARRAENMLALADRWFDTPPKYIDLGSGMFGRMAPAFAAQFPDVPTYEEYAQAVAGRFAARYGTDENRPILFTEPGTTLINKYIDLIARVEAIKTIRQKPFAVLNCSEHNLGETCTLKELPMEILPIGEGTFYEKLDMTGYTCLEQDVMRRDYTGTVGVGDYVCFGNVGGYSNVLKPPFIAPNCAMIARKENGETRLMKRAETFDDIFGTYEF